MYRTTVNRLLLQTLRSTTSRTTSTILPTITTNRLSTTTASSSPQNPNPVNPDQSHLSKTTSDDSSRTRGGTDYQKEQFRLLHSSLPLVNRLGWGEAALMAAARELGISPSIVGSFPRKDAALVEYFMDECLEKLIDMIESNEDLRNLISSERVAKLLKTRLEMQAPYITKWPQALSIQAMPANVPTSFKQRAALVDEIWHAAGDESSDLDWYAKRTVLGGIYSTTEIYMLTDKSPDFRDTWAFLNSRIRDAFDLKKSLQEAQYLAETVGAGLGGSFQGLVKGLKL